MILGLADKNLGVMDVGQKRRVIRSDKGLLPLILDKYPGKPFRPGVLSSLLFLLAVASQLYNAGLAR